MIEPTEIFYVENVDERLFGIFGWGGFLGEINTKKKLVLVEWGDAHANGSWVEEDQVLGTHRAGKVTIVGFVVKRDAEGISIVQGFAENGQYTGHFFVPAGMIRKIKNLKY